MTSDRRTKLLLSALLAPWVWGCSVVGAPAPLPGPPVAEAPVVEAPVEPELQPGADAAHEPAAPIFRPVRRFEEVRGLWVVRSTLTSEGEIRSMIERAEGAGFNTIVVQVRGRADAFYQSSLEPRGEAMRAPTDFDPLAFTIQEAHGRGIAVHAWVNTHLVWGPVQRPQSPSHMVNARPDWLSVPRALAGELFTLAPNDPRYFEILRSYADRNRATVEGIYSSPSHPEVQARVHEVWMDLLDRYDLDGIHFDYIRYPSSDFDYGRGTLERFRAWVAARDGANGGVPSHFGSAREALAFVDARPEAWGDFRREHVTALVRRIYHDVKARRPEVVVSAAVFADADDAYRHRFQDWRNWLAEGILDIAVPMAYTPDNTRFDRLIAEARAAAGSRERTWAGIGAYLTGLQGTLEKIDIARFHDAGGIVLFSYDWAANEAPGEDDEPFLDRISRERFHRGPR